jgi:hypothetical protein
MPLTTAQVHLYAATTVDYQLALGAAAVAGIPAANVTGDFYQAWQEIASGNFLVIAVGGAANDALYFNACGWSNPAGQAGGTTPFYTSASPTAALPGANYYENAAGANRIQTGEIAAALAYYAVNGQFLTGYSTYPPAAAPESLCSGSPTVACPCSSTPPSGTITFAQAEGYWVAAGGPAAEAATAAAITGAESSFQPGAIQPSQPYITTGWGLWQITPGDSEPQFGEDYQMLDPFNNAEAAVAKYEGANNTFQPWTTYNDGAYLQFLPPNPPPPAQVSDPGQYVPIGSAPAGTHNTSQPGKTGNG